MQVLQPEAAGEVLLAWSVFAACGVGLAQDPGHRLASIMGAGSLGLRGQEDTVWLL